MNKIFVIYIIILFNFSSCGILYLVSNEEESLANTLGFDSPNVINLPPDIVCQWKLVSVRISIYEQFMLTLNSDKAPTLGISGDGYIGGHDGCNGYSGKIVMDNNKNITFSNLLATSRGCPPGAYWHDKFYKALGCINNYVVQDNKLLLKQDSHVLMTFSKITRPQCGTTRPPQEI